MEGTFPHTQLTLTSALQFDGVVVLSHLAVTFVAADSIGTEAPFAHLLTKQCTFICICEQAERRQVFAHSESLCWVTLKNQNWTVDLCQSIMVSCRGNYDVNRNEFSLHEELSDRLRYQLYNYPSLCISLCLNQTTIFPCKQYQQKI